MAVKQKLVEKERPRELVSSREQEQVSRGVLACLRVCPELPCGVGRAAFEYLGQDKPCMALSTIQGTYITKRYMGGDYMADYQFKLIYRAQPSDDGGRLRMDEDLDAVGDWLRWQRPGIGAGKQVRKITVNAPAALFGRYANGDEDHQILMTLSYYSERSRT